MSRLERATLIPLRGGPQSRPGGQKDGANYGGRARCGNRSFYLERGVATENFYLGLAFQVDAKDKHRARKCASGGRGKVIALLGDGEMASPRKECASECA